MARKQPPAGDRPAPAKPKRATRKGALKKPPRPRTAIKAKAKAKAAAQTVARRAVRKPSGTPPAKPGRPEFPTSAAMRRAVHDMVMCGVQQDEIGRAIGCDAKTLRKHFRKEIDQAAQLANARVARSLFQMATTGKNAAAAMFWLKARAGWRDAFQIETVDGPPRDPASFTDAELAAYIAAGRGVAAGTPDDQEGSDGVV